MLDPYRRFERFDCEGTEAIVAEVETGIDPLPDYMAETFKVGYVKIPKGHRDYGIHYESEEFPIVYDAVAYEITYSGPWDGDDWWIGFDTGHPYWDIGFDEARRTAMDLAAKVMGRCR